MSNTSFVTCLICGAKKRELNGHLRMHSLTASGYLALHPGAAIISEQSARLKSSGVSRSHEANPRSISEETKKKIAAKSREMHHRRRAEDPEGYLAISRRSAAAARAAKGKDYRHSDETLAKMRGERPHTSKPKSAEHRAKISAARKGVKRAPHSEQTKQRMREAWERRRADKDAYAAYVEAVSARMSAPDRVEALRTLAARLVREGNHNGKSRDTALERRMASFLTNHGVAFEAQFILHTPIGDFAYDFLLPTEKLLVEVDGEYWHAKAEAHARDKIKMRLAEERGYRIVRISDKDWKPELALADADTATAHTRALMERRAVALSNPSEVEPRSRRAR